MLHLVVATEIKRRIAFWLAALGAALMVGAFQLGTFIMNSGLPAT